MRMVGPYSNMGQGALSIGDEFIVGRTGFSVNRFDFGISEAIGARPTMEDRTLVIQSLQLEPSHGYYKGYVCVRFFPYSLRLVPSTSFLKSHRPFVSDFTGSRKKIWKN